VSFCGLRDIGVHVLSLHCRWADCISSHSEVFAASTDSILTLMSTVKSHHNNLQRYQADRLEQVNLLSQIPSMFLLQKLGVLFFTC